MIAALIRFLGGAIRTALVLAASVGAGLLVAICTADSFGLEPLVWLLLSCASGVFVAVVIFRSERSCCRDAAGSDEALVVQYLDDSESSDDPMQGPAAPDRTED